MNFGSIMQQTLNPQSQSGTEFQQQVQIKTKKLNNGMEIPVIGLGTSKMAGQSAAALEAMKYALKIGYKHIDTAWVYFVDPIFRRALEETCTETEGRLKREELFVTCKVWNTFHSKDMVKLGLLTTLNNLGLDYLDLYYIHWPIAFHDSPVDPFPKDTEGNLLFSDVSYLETYHAMEEFVKQGKLKSIGVCNFNIKQLQDILENCEIKPVVNQIEVSPYLQNDKLIEFCQNNGIAVVAYSTVGAGDIVAHKEKLSYLLNDETLINIGKKYNKTAAQVCIRWALQRDLIVLARSLKPEEILQNAQVFDFELSQEDMAEIKKLNKNLRIYSEPEFKKHKFYPFNEE